MTPRTAQPAKHEARKEAILQAGLEVLWEKGYNGTGVKDLVEAAGIPKGSFYFYFDSKEDFAVEALEYYIRQNNPEQGLLAQATGHDPLERLQAYAALRMEGIASCSTSIKRGCMLSNLMAEMTGQNDAIRAAVLRGERKLRQPVIDLLQEAIDEGQLPADEDPEAMAAFMESTIRGAVTSAKAMQSREPLDQALHYLFDRWLQVSA